ncbi:MAG: prolipoprotein diacylglyceryl transferase [Dehalococcoidia bacterium]|nr:prolipoprotein diacylglyceryl transferase [Dehalococcoidia bacterium]
MINIDIAPVAFSIGIFEVRWYGIMVVLAIVAVIAISLLEARRVGLAEDHIYSMGLWAIIGGVLVSRLFHVIDKWEYYMANPAQIIRFEGLTVYGAVLGALLAVFIYCRVKKLSFWQVGDVVAPGAILGQAIGRIGCFINGCCYGLPTSLPWGVVYTNPDSYGPAEAVQPTQIYHLLWNLIGFGILWSLRRRLKPQGSLFLLYLAVYAAGDLGIRFVRDGEPFRSGMFFNMQQAQIIGIIILGVTVPWLVIRMWRYRANRPVSADVSEVNETDQNQGA